MLKSKHGIKILLTKLNGFEVENGGIVLRLSFHYEIKRIIFKSANDNEFKFRTKGLAYEKK